VLQLICIFIGLCVSIPFAAYHEAVTVPIFQVKNIKDVANSFTLACKGLAKGRSWLGKWSDVSGWAFGEWADYYLLLIFGGIPWQVYFQRVLSSDTGKLFLFTKERERTFISAPRENA